VLFKDRTALQRVYPRLLRYAFTTFGAGDVLRNRDVRRLLDGTDSAAAPAEVRRRSAAVTRQLRLLRGHGLIDKVPRTHRYLVSEGGRRALTSLLAARHASTERLTACAA
jgi:hypothetical protein